MLFLALGVLHAEAQTYSVEWFKIGGSSVASMGGIYQASSSVGQPEAGAPLSGGSYSASASFVKFADSGFLSPIAEPLTISRTAGLTLKIALTELASNWSDPYGFPVELTAVNLTSTNGQHIYPLNLTTAANGAYTIASTAFLGYVNHANVDDQITYTISDGLGHTSDGLINIVVSTSPLFGQTTGIVNPAGGSATLNFAGYPGYNYSVQRSTDLLHWKTIWTTNAPPAGPFQYTDTFSDLGGIAPRAAYYRLSWNP